MSKIMKWQYLLFLSLIACAGLLSLYLVLRPPGAPEKSAIANVEDQLQAKYEARLRAAIGLWSRQIKQLRYKVSATDRTLEDFKRANNVIKSSDGPYSCREPFLVYCRPDFEFMSKLESNAKTARSHYKHFLQLYREAGGFRRLLLKPV